MIHGQQIHRLAQTGGQGHLVPHANAVKAAFDIQHDYPVADGQDGIVEWGPGGGIACQFRISRNAANS